MTNIIAKIEDIERFLLDWFVKHFSHEVTQDRVNTAGYARVHAAYADLRTGLIPPVVPALIEAPVEQAPKETIDSASIDKPVEIAPIEEAAAIVEPVAETPVASIPVVESPIEIPLGQEQVVPNEVIPVQ